MIGAVSQAELDQWLAELVAVRASTLVEAMQPVERSVTLR